MKQKKDSVIQVTTKKLCSSCSSSKMFSGRICIIYKKNKELANFVFLNS